MLRVGDNHCHLNPIRGMGVKAFAKRFRSSGGWFVGLVNLTSWSLDVLAREPSDFEKVYALTVTAAEELRGEGLRVAVILGPHPAELARLVDHGIKPEKAAEVIWSAYEIAGRYVKEGRADGLGEVGRPHWQAPQPVIEACNRVFERVAELAGELDCVVHIHAERGGEATINDLASRLSAKRGKFVLHHIEGSRASYARQKGFIPSVPAKESEVIAAIRGTVDFVVESDFLDDPKRPGAVVVPWSIPRLFRRLIDENVLREKEAEDILVINIERLYGITVEQ